LSLDWLAVPTLMTMMVIGSGDCVSYTPVFGRDEGKAEGCRDWPQLVEEEK